MGSSSCIWRGPKSNYKRNKLPKSWIVSFNSLFSIVNFSVTSFNSFFKSLISASILKFLLNQFLKFSWSWDMYNVQWIEVTHIIWEFLANSSGIRPKSSQLPRNTKRPSTFSLSPFTWYWFAYCDNSIYLFSRSLGV